MTIIPWKLAVGNDIAPTPYYLGIELCIRDHTVSLEFLARDEYVILLMLLWKVRCTDNGETQPVQWKENPIKQHIGPAIAVGKAPVACRVTSDSGESRRKAWTDKAWILSCSGPHQHTNSLLGSALVQCSAGGLDGWVQCRADELKSHMALSSAIFSNPVCHNNCWHCEPSCVQMPGTA